MKIRPSVDLLGLILLTLSLTQLYNKVVQAAWESHRT